MKLRVLVGGAVFSAAAMLLCTQVSGGEEGAPGNKEAFEALVQAAQSSDEHETFSDLRGKWQYDLKWWLSPGSEPVEVKGKSVFEWTFGRRFIMEESKDQRMGIAYEGRMLIGYDRGAKAYTMARWDVLGTGIVTGQSQAGASGNTITFQGTYVHPVSGTNVKTRSVLQIDRKNPSLVIYETSADGQEYKSMEVTYARIVRRGA